MVLFFSCFVVASQSAAYRSLLPPSPPYADKILVSTARHDIMNGRQLAGYLPDTKGACARRAALPTRIVCCTYCTLDNQVGLDSIGKHSEPGTTRPRPVFLAGAGYIRKPQEWDCPPPHPRPRRLRLSGSPGPRSQAKCGKNSRRRRSGAEGKAGSFLPEMADLAPFFQRLGKTGESRASLSHADRQRENHQRPLTGAESLGIVPT